VAVHCALARAKLSDKRRQRVLGANQGSADGRHRAVTRSERSCNIPPRFGSRRDDVGPADNKRDGVSYPYRPVA
jgi:hypothetical protein